MWRYVPLVLILYLCAAPSFAQVPQAKTVQGKAAQDGTSAVDYKRDVAQAVDIRSREKQLSHRHEKKEIDEATYRKSYEILNADLVRLVKKWNVAGRGNEFARDYLQPDVDAAVAAAAAAQNKMVKGDISGVDYKRDVEQAADLVLRKGQVARRYLNKEIDAATYDKSIKVLDAGLTPLIGKWQAVGRESEFQRDYLQRVSALAAAQSQAGGSTGGSPGPPTADSTLGPWKHFLEGWEPFMEGFVLFNVGLLILTLILALRNESGPRLDADSKEVLRLPDSLRRISVFRKEYDVSFKSGKLYEKEIWTETDVTTTTSGGGTYQTGGTATHTPISTSTHVSSTVYHRFWLRSPDGHEFWWRVSGDALSATTGQVISRIDSAGGHGLMLYNHSTGQFFTHRSWYSAIHKPTPLGCWIVTGAALAGFLLLASLHRSAFQTIWGWSLVGIAWVFAVFIVWAIPTSILYTIVRTTRNRQFEKRVVPAFRRFLKEATPELLARFPALPT